MKKFLFINVIILLTGYATAQTDIRPSFSTPSKNVCNKTEISFTNQTVVSPPSTNTRLQLKYIWGDGDTSIVYAKSQEQVVTTHVYNLPLMENKVEIKLKATIIDTATSLPSGVEAEYIDSIVVSRPIAAFTDDGHEFSCPDNMSGVKGRTVTFTNQSQGKLGPSSILEWNFGDTIRGIPPITANDNDNPTHHYKHAGTYDVLLIVQDENRCRDSVLKRNHVVILGPRGSFSYYEESGNCKPLMVTFIPFVEEEPEYLPDSIQIHTGTGTMIVNRGDYYGVRRTGRTVYNEAGVYLPVCFLYKTVEFNGKEEFCLVQLNGEDTIYVIDLQPKFETEPLSGFDTINPTRFNNTSTWIPSYLHDSLVSVKWDMGNGDSSQNYNAETRYERTGKYAVELTMQVSNCIKVYTDTIVVTPQTGISTPDKAEKVKLYPNPSTGEINIEFADAKQRDIKLHNAHGRILHQKTYSEQKIQLFLEDLSTGTYYILIDNSTSVKFIIER